MLWTFVNICLFRNGDRKFLTAKKKKSEVGLLYVSVQVMIKAVAYEVQPIRVAEVCQEEKVEISGKKPEISEYTDYGM